MRWRTSGCEAAETEWLRIRDGARLAASLGLEVHAGHGLDFATAEAIAALPEIVELNIGHFLDRRGGLRRSRRGRESDARGHGSRARKGEAA